MLDKRKAFFFFILLGTHLTLALTWQRLIFLFWAFSSFYISSTLRSKVLASISLTFLLGYNLSVWYFFFSPHLSSSSVIHVTEQELSDNQNRDNLQGMFQWVFLWTFLVIILHFVSSSFFLFSIYILILSSKHRTFSLILIIFMLFYKMYHSDLKY